MKAIHVPRIDARYWAGISMASVFGANTGEMFVGVLVLWKPRAQPAPAAA